MKSLSIFHCVSLGLMGVLGLVKELRSATENSASCCTAIEAEYPNQVIYQVDETYEEANARWTQNAQLAPTCIFLPETAHDVSTAVKIFVAQACPFSIKSGGHTPWAGANDIDGGIAIDFSKMNDTAVSDDRSYVRLGPGGTWHNIYKQLNGTGLAFPGGRCPGTGVGGLTLGGGYSWFTGRVGFVADNIINYEIVLANGDIRNVNATDDADLYLALKGGSNNFGVVTHFDLSVFEHRQRIYGGLAIVPINVTDAVLERFSELVSASKDFPESDATLEFFLNGTNAAGQQILLWLSDTDDTNLNGPHEALQPLLDLEPKILDRVGVTTLVDYPHDVPPVTRVLMTTATFVNAPSVVQGVHQLTLDHFEKSFSGIPNLVFDFQYTPIPRHVTEQSLVRGGNIMGLNDTTDDLIIVLLMPLWQDAAYDDDIYALSQDWLRLIHDYTNSVGAGSPFEFVNYAAPFQDPMASYGDSNLEFLRGVSEKYDPGRVFQKLVPGGFKLGI
ncbi:uncharacterized protein JN550_003815 [Neoarthrinium moseri]|uniref:uncharacterized protein n=1 Tax=Neoarthrinium moseri TaxID=1658444 RepID=UPI001FDC0C7C|nr:uncharacterized protein JN550_003815 [Neoarthrinium moseri]KAI1872941.1 hypothetical protein JN550_003815 [Neoarthrinium moseri]